MHTPVLVYVSVLTSSQQGIKGAEIKWLNSKEVLESTTDSKGNANLTIPVLDEGKGVLSIYHPDYRPEIKQVEIPIKSNREYTLPAFELVALQPESELDSALFREISTALREINQSLQQLLQAQEGLEQVSSPSLEQEEQLIEITNDHLQLKFQARTLREDSLLYALREIDQAAMRHTLSRVQRKQVEILSD
ncbi:MAG: hypothetical protein AAF399_12130 [Bacteroidota bacterium]